jgi:hypothetical protein
MKEQEKLYQSITDVDQRYLEEIDRPIEKKRRRPVLVAACLAAAVALCGFGYGIYWGVGTADGLPFSALTQDLPTDTSDIETEEEASCLETEKSDLIADYSDVFAEYSINCATEGGEIPSIYFSPNYMVIFTQTEDCGWTLDDGEELNVSLNLNEKQSITLEFGYVLDGQYHALSTSKGNTFSDTFQAPETGEYYFCVTNRSSANAVVEGGNILAQN